eukprot:CCRYP_003430-RB/>CCRYP_003430-RB protein AED:0.01 eAED:0.01 QI:127/1/1/1/1/1/2/1364/967
MSTSFWNLFSPKRTPDVTAQEHDEALQDHHHQQQRHDGAIAGEIRDNSAVDPLADFFNGLPAQSAATDVTTSLSYAQWREGRKRFLVRYFEHRLVGVEDDDSRQRKDDEYDDGVCSFRSEVLDDEFDNNPDLPTPGAESHADSGDRQDYSQPLETQDMHTRHQTTITAEAAALSNKQREDDEGTPDSHQEMNLETQPQSPLHAILWNTSHSQQTTPNSTTSRSKSSSDKANSLPNTGLRRKSVGTVLLSGIKRKLGFLTQREEDEEENDNKNKLSPNRKENHSSTHPDLDSQTPIRPTKKKKYTTSQRGLMWNANVASVPHISETLHTVTKLNELDLYTAKLDLGLCRVLRIWKLRHTKRMEGRRQVSLQLCRDALDDVEEECGMHCMNPDASHSMNLEDDGPLNTIYKKVLSMELVSIQEEPLHDPNVPLSSPRVSNLATAAFQSGSIQLQKASERKRRHAVRRVRIFFYNGYAEALSRVLSDIAESKSGKKKNLMQNYVLSLANVPAHCIMPHTFSRKGDQSSPHLQQYVDNPFGDEEYGVPSPYCICIGDSASLKFGSEKLYFDSEELEIRLAGTPPVAVSAVAEETSMEMGDAIVTNRTVEASGLGYAREEGSSVLMERYWNLSGAASGQRRGGMTFLVGDEDTIHAGPPDETVATGVVSDIQRDEGANDNVAAHVSSNAGEGTHSGEATALTENSGIVRPPSVEPLSSMLPLLLENGMKRLKDPITVYGVVLGFSAPSLTTTKEWKMSMVLIDESLPISIESQDQQQSGGCPPSSDATSSSKEVHVPSITVVLFVKNKLHLPVIRSAGDIVCCRNAILQQYNCEPQLLCSRKGSVVVVRPTRVRNPGVELPDSTAPNDWNLSCSCHEDGGNAAHLYVDWSLTNTLWRWGQQRLASHPTMSPNCKISIAGLDEPSETLESSVSGDLTAAITAIIPHPEHLRRRDTARGYIRLWDGTGPPRSDP